MKKTILSILLLLLLLPASGLAVAWTPETLPMVHLQNRLQYLCNPDTVISEATTAQVDAMLRQLEDSTGVQTVCVVVKHLEGDDPYTFGMDLSRKYGIGLAGQNSGLIIILATEDRSYQILTGEGLEATLPDAVCSRVERRIMVPHLKEGDWDGAILMTVKALSQYIKGDDSLVPAESDGDSDGEDFVTLLFLGGFVVLFFWSLTGTRRRDCPVCKKEGALRRKSMRYLTIDGRHIVRTVWVCKHCGHREQKDEDSPDGNGGISHRRGFGPLFMGGSGMSGSFGGGGFSGGSFGGGSFGGGGAGGRF